MAAHDLTEAEVQHVGVKRSLDAQRHRYVVEGAARFELIDEPEALLGEGEEERAFPGEGDQRRSRQRYADLPRCLDALCEIRQHRSLEEIAQRHLDTEGGAQ